MMKGILGFSVFLNLVLGYFLLTKKDPETQIVVEKETVVRPILVKQEVSEAPASPKREKTEEKKKDLQDFANFEQSEFQDAGEKMENDRHEFFTEKLGMTEDKIAEHNRLRDEFFRQTSSFWQKDPTRELTFKERRQMIDMEESYHAKLQKLHGKKNWENYQKYRERYNAKGFKKQQEENQPFLFMGL